MFSLTLLYTNLIEEIRVEKELYPESCLSEEYLFLYPLAEVPSFCVTYGTLLLWGFLGALLTRIFWKLTKTWKDQIDWRPRFFHWVAWFFWFLVISRLFLILVQFIFLIFELWEGENFSFLFLLGGVFLVLLVFLYLWIIDPLFEYKKKINRLNNQIQLRSLLLSIQKEVFTNKVSFLLNEHFYLKYLNFFRRILAFFMLFFVLGFQFLLFMSLVSWDTAQFTAFFSWYSTVFTWFCQVFFIVILLLLIFFENLYEKENQRIIRGAVWKHLKPSLALSSKAFPSRAETQSLVRYVGGASRLLEKLGSVCLSCAAVLGSSYLSVKVVDEAAVQVNEMEKKVYTREAGFRDRLIWQGVSYYQHNVSTVIPSTPVQVFEKVKTLDNYPELDEVFKNKNQPLPELLKLRVFQKDPRFAAGLNLNADSKEITSALKAGIESNPLSKDLTR